MGSRADKMDDYAGRIELIPWDPTDPKQFDRMTRQRVACGWSQFEVSEWKDKALRGEKFMYWVKLSDTMPGAQKMVEAHMEQFPDEREPLAYDTPMSPTKASFVPVGHVGLEILPELNTRFSLPDGSFWIKSLYISRSLQSSGIGRSAMTRLEHLIASPPHNTTVVAIDTVQKEWQLGEDSLRRTYDDNGLVRPAKPRTNEDWYARQGYEVMGRAPVQLIWPEDGVSELPFVFMKKGLV